MNVPFTLHVCCSWMCLCLTDFHRKSSSGFFLYERERKRGSEKKGRGKRRKKEKERRLKRNFSTKHTFWKRKEKKLNCKLLETNLTQRKKKKSVFLQLFLSFFFLSFFLFLSSFSPKRRKKKLNLTKRIKLGESNFLAGPVFGMNSRMREKEERKEKEKRKKKEPTTRGERKEKESTSTVTIMKKDHLDWVVTRFRSLFFFSLLSFFYLSLSIFSSSFFLFLEERERRKNWSDRAMILITFFSVTRIRKIRERRKSTSNEVLFSSPSLFSILFRSGLGEREKEGKKERKKGEIVRPTVNM